MFFLRAAWAPSDCLPSVPLFPTRRLATQTRSVSCLVSEPSDLPVIRAPRVQTNTRWQLSKAMFPVEGSSLLTAVWKSSTSPAVRRPPFLPPIRKVEHGELSGSLSGGGEKKTHASLQNNNNRALRVAACMCSQNPLLMPPPPPHFPFKSMLSL